MIKAIYMQQWNMNLPKQALSVNQQALIYSSDSLARARRARPSEFQRAQQRISVPGFKSLFFIHIELFPTVIQTYKINVISPEFVDSFSKEWKQNTKLVKC